MEEQNYQNMTKINEIDINTPEGIEEVEQIFDAHPISTQELPDKNLEQQGIVGTTNTFLEIGADTNGVYSLFDTYAPPGTGPKTHIYNGANEVFKVLDGSITFQFGNQVKIANPGDVVAVPEGNLHGWKNLEDEPARMIVFSTPSGDIENTFREAGDPVTDPSQPLPGDPLKVEETFAKHNTDSYPEADLVGKPPVTDGGQIFYGKQYSETITGSDGSDTILGRNEMVRIDYTVV